MSVQKLAIVTGANKGIGYSITKGLCKTLGNEKRWKIMLTARNESLGKKAVEDLKSEGFDTLWHQLDITKKESIDALVKDVQTKFGGCDLLVNNAGLASMHDPFLTSFVKPDKDSTPESMASMTVDTMKINYFGTLNLTQAILPLLRTNGRIMSVSSRASHRALKGMKNELAEKFFDPNLTIEGLNTLLNEYISAANNDKLIENGWYESPYCMSKVGVSVMTIILTKSAKNGHVISCMCPGYCNTSLNSHSGQMTPDQGADTVIWFANLPENEAKTFHGKFLADRKDVGYK